MKEESLIEAISRTTFISRLNEVGKVYFVGGCVRDSLLNKPCKDIDLVVIGIEQTNLIDLLNQYGKTELVGQSFGVIKFFPNEIELEEPIDIALPRTETSTGDGHKDFEVVFSHDKISLEEDLKRRDFTINSIALDSSTLTLIDPYNGIYDLVHRKIVAVNETAFSDDPLRMIRAIQFASRFEFEIEETTMSSLIANAHLITTVSGERILIELDKIFYKAQFKSIGFELLIKTNIYYHLFGDCGFKNSLTFINKANTRSDFYYILLADSDVTNCFIHRFVNVLRGDVDTLEQMKLLHTLLLNESTDKVANLQMVFKSYHVKPILVQSSLIGQTILLALEIAKNQKYPTQIKELAINGDDLLELGFKGKEIGDKLNFIYRSILSNEILNIKEDIITFVTAK